MDKFEFRSKKLLCLVTLPNQQTLALEVEKSADGRELIKKVCERIHTVETDYFGLKYTTSVGELLWLNLRNRLSSEIAGSLPYRLQLAIKFFVQPEYIYQSSTRQLFYDTLKQRFVEGSLQVTSADVAVRLGSLLIQSEILSDSDDSLSCSCLCSVESCFPAVHRTKENIEKALSLIDTSNDKCVRGQFLSEVASLSLYGVHYHNVYDDVLEKNLRVGIGPEGMTWIDDSWAVVYSIPYSALQKAVHDNSSVNVHIIQDNASVVKHRLSMSKKSGANAFYRDLTEMFSFFHCNTIGSVVSEQFCRDLKGIIVSIFNENTNLGRKYVFDIERTLQESCDRTQRALFSSSQYRLSILTRSSLSCHNNKPMKTSDDSVPSNVTEEKSATSDMQSLNEAVRELKSIETSLTCQICVDADINTALVPCGHVVCCIVCAYRLTSCPLCKHDIESVQSVYLPISKPVSKPVYELTNSVCAAL